MRYKVGDKVKVRSDLKENISYGGQIFVRDMAVHCGKNVEISKVYDDAYCIKESDREWFWSDEMFEGLAEDELTAEEEEYGTDDLIALHEGKMHWQGISGDKGLGYAYGVNGKTTAYSNGICGNYGSRQDWGM